MAETKWVTGVITLLIGVITFLLLIGPILLEALSFWILKTHPIRAGLGNKKLHDYVMTKNNFSSIIQTHPVLGYSIIKQVESPNSNTVTL